MKKLFLTAASCAALMSASSASAAEIFFDFVSSDNQVEDFSFTLDENPTPDIVFSQDFRINNVDVLTPTGIVTTNIGFFETGIGGGLEAVPLASIPTLVLFGPQVFQGTINNPTFAPGSFEFFNQTTSLGVLTLSRVNSAVPEPGTWMLMILGFGAIGAMMRRKQSTAKLKVSYS
jgi:hypothetical protein